MDRLVCEVSQLTMCSSINLQYILTVNNGIYHLRVRRDKRSILRSSSSRAACRELSGLHKVTAVNKSAAHEAVLSAEQTARQELTESLEKQRVEHHREKEQLLLEVILHNHVFEPVHYGISHWWKWKNRCSEMKGDVGMAHLKNKNFAYRWRMH